MLTHSLRSIVSKQWMGYAVGLVAVAFVSAAIDLLETRVHIENISMLYLLAVFATAIAFGRGPAVVASLAAFLTFNFFFVEPIHTLTVADPAEWVALMFFLITAIITGQLTARERHRAMQAEQREREAVVLYDVVRLMGGPDLDRALHDVAERLRWELRLAAVVIEVADSSEFSVKAMVGEAEARKLAYSTTLVPTRVLSEGSVPTAARRAEPGRWTKVVPPSSASRNKKIFPESERLHVVPVLIGDRRVGNLMLVRQSEAQRFDSTDDRLLSAVAAQLGLAVERARLRREATDMEILRRTDELKTALLNAVSHELRTPLASIIASAGSLRQTDVDWSNEARQQFAEAIDEEARRLNLIVGNLLDLSRIEAGSLRAEKSWHDLGALLDDVLARLRPITENHIISTDVQDDLPPVLLDYVQIDQVLSNLIENAVRYTPAGTEIVISARCSGGQLRVEVADRGPGIPQSALPHLFEPFYRANSSTTSSKGTGLGLAVARGLVEAHGGLIWVENRQDRGALFTFTLPLTIPSEATTVGELR